MIELLKNTFFSFVGLAYFVYVVIAIVSDFDWYKLVAMPMAFIGLSVCYTYAIKVSKVFKKDQT